MKKDIYRTKRIGVLGLSRSGVAASELARRSGATVFATELNPVTCADVERLRSLGVEVELGEHTDSVYHSDLIVISPGIGPENRVVKEIHKRRIPILSELEFAWSLLPSPLFVAVTGTNGKSTTCALVGDILKTAGKDVLVGGNIGVPLSTLVEKAGPDTYVVAEVSTFQLEYVTEFRPWISVLTNITEDHLDRHRDMSTYTSLKKRIFENQSEPDFAVINLSDRISVEIQDQIRSQKFCFSHDREVARGTFIRNGKIIFRDGAETELLSARSVPLGRVASVDNVLAASTVSLIIGLEPSAIGKAVQDFRGLPHRLQEIVVRNGVRWINNSMCTNPVSARTSILSLPKPVVLIAGGKEKGLDPEPLVDVIAESVKFTILMGESKEELAKRLHSKGYGRFSTATDMEDAVRMAYAQAATGDTVVLCPGYSSQDMYANFEERGKAFASVLSDLYGLNHEE